MSKKIDKMKILENFIEEPEREFHIRELANIMKLSPTTITYYLDEFNRQSILKKEKSRNLVLFKANTDSEKFLDSKISHNLSRLKNCKIIDLIDKEFNHPESVIVFGSYARGEDFENSDIDIAIITPIKKISDFSKFESRLKRKVNIHLLSRERVERMKKENKELLNNIINGRIIKGYLELFK